jgi:YesN/AraC family two-component response regulator
LSNKAVLVVDDDQLVRETLIDVIELVCDCEIFQAVDGEDGYQQAKKLLAEDRKLLIITDVNMPKMSGFGLVQLLLEDAKKANIIIMSGYIENKEKVKEQFPDITFMSKPIDLKQCTGIIESLYNA